MKAICVLVLLAAPAFADNKDADALFKKAKKLHAEKKYAEACPMFEQTDALDPGIGAKLNVAKCYEDWGMLARAYQWYVDAEKMAIDAKDDRAPKINKLYSALDGDVPKITIKLPDGVDAGTADVHLDGKPFADLGKEHRIDPGPHEVTWMVGTEKKSKLIPMERGGELDMTLDLKATGVASTKKKASKTAPEEPSPPGHTRRIAGITIGAAGLVGFGVASYLTLDARSKYNDAIDAHCMGDKSMCDDEGLKITKDARSRANIATVVTVISLAAIAGGVVLYVTAPKGSAEKKTALYLSPTATENSAGLVFGGGF